MITVTTRTGKYAKPTAAGRLSRMASAVQRIPNYGVDDGGNVGLEVLAVFAYQCATPGSGYIQHFIGVSYYSSKLRRLAGLTAHLTGRREVSVRGKI